MRRFLLAVLGLVVIGMLPVPGAAAQVPMQDSVVLTGGPASAGRFLSSRSTQRVGRAARIRPGR